MATQLTRNTILSLLKAEKSYLTKEFGVVNIGLFGSFARGQSDRNSDIDLIVELREPRFDYLAGLQIYLEKKLSRKIEIVRKGNRINSRFVQRVEKDTIDVVVVDVQLLDEEPLTLVTELMKKQPLINCAMVSSLPHEDFHEYSEGLGVFMQLPLSPGEEEAEKMLEILKSIDVLLKA